MSKHTQTKVICSWCGRDLGAKDGPEGVSDGICVLCLTSRIDISPSQWILMVSIELDQLDADLSKQKDWTYDLAADELRRLSGESVRVTKEADPTIPPERRPLFGFGMQFADGLN